MHNCQVIVIGSGIGGLTAAARLARDGKQVLVTESHAIAGGAAHSFARRGFTFDSTPRSTAASATRVAHIRCDRFSTFWENLCQRLLMISNPVASE